MKWLVVIVLCFPFAGYSQQKVTKGLRFNLKFSSFCNYDYDLERCVESLQAPVEIVIVLEEGGSGRLVTFIEDKTTMKIESAWYYTNCYTFNIVNDQNYLVEGFLYFNEDKVATKLILKPKGSQQSLIFY